MAARRCVVLLLAVAKLCHRLWRSLSGRVRALFAPLTPPSGFIIVGIWIVVAPLLAWAIATLYVPLITPFLQERARWGVASASTLLLGAALLGHVWVHTIVAQLLGSRRPPRVPLYPWGDAAQVWPAARTPLREAVIALSGPAFNLLVAYVAYRVWDRQLHVYSNLVALLVAVVNLVMAVINLAPGFPFDGGRLTRAIMWGLLHQPALGSRLGRRLGYGIGWGLIGWSLLLLAQRARFGVETGSSTLGAALLFLWALRRHHGDHGADPPPHPFRPYGVRGVIAGTLLVGLLAAAGSLVPTTHGIRMPGGAVPLESMISVPAPYRHAPSGSFMMTTVFEQTPITAAQWVYGHLSASSEIVEPERIMPVTVTPRERIEHSYRLLEQSERTAMVVALRMAGYQTLVRGTVIEVVDVRPDTWAAASLQPGDRIWRLNGTPLLNSDDLWAQLYAHDPAIPLDLELVRNSTLLQLQGAFTPHADDVLVPPFTVRAAEPYTEAPFAVGITPQKIIGGPSVGLMFTLSMYNELTPGDLTGGRRVAGTGTIDLAGRVGPIGGVAQKVAAAEAAGAQYFLVPAANAADAHRVARRIQVLEVETVEQAIELLRALPPAESQS